MKNLIYKSLIPVFITCIMIVNLVHTMDVKADPVFAVKEWNRNGSLSSEEGTIVYDKIIVTSDTGNEDFVWEDQYINIKLEDKESTVVKAVSADADIVTVKDLYKISSGFYSFTIIPMGVGKTQITLTDQYGQTIKKDVEVKKSYMDGIKEYYNKTLTIPYGSKQMDFSGPMYGKVTAKAGTKTLKVYTKKGENQWDHYIRNNPVMKAGTKITITFNRNGYSFTKVIKVGKAANPLQVKGKTAKVSYKRLKKKAVSLKRAKALKVTKAKGKVTYKLVSVEKKKFKKYFKVNAKTGKLQVKKRLKKGTYKLKIKVKAAGNSNYKAASKNVNMKIQVK